MLLDDVTKAVVKTVRKICEKYLDPRRLEEIARKAIEEAGERSVLAESISSLKTKLDAMTKRIDKIYADRLDGLLAEDDFDRLYKKLCDERQRLRDQLREAQSRSEHEGQDAAMACCSPYGSDVRSETFRCNVHVTFIQRNVPSTVTSFVHGTLSSFSCRHIATRCLPAGSVTHTVRPLFPHHAFYVVRVPLSLLPFLAFPCPSYPHTGTCTS